MRLVAMQLLTWGTIVGAIVSALLLAALEAQAPGIGIGSHLVAPLPGEPTQAGRRRIEALPTPASAASAAPTR